MTRVVATISMVFLLAPFVVVVGASFDAAKGFHIRFPPQDLTLTWYQNLPVKYVESLWVSTVVATVVALISVILGLLIALGLVRGRVISRPFFESFFNIPVQIPLVVTGAVFLQFFYQFLAVTGINALNSVAALVIAHTFVSIPYCIGSISSVLVRIDDHVEEASAILGASQWETFRLVTLPAIRPGLLAGMFYAFVLSFGDVPIAIFLTGPGTTTLPVQIFQDMQFDFQPGMLAISAVIVIVSLVAVVGIQKIIGLDLVLPSKRK